MIFNLIYLLVVALASPLLLYRAVRHGKYREGWSAKWLGQTKIAATPRRRIWMHAVSVGEINLLRGVVARWEARHPEDDVVISTTTATGYRLAREHFGSARVFYMPLDFTWAVSRALRDLSPAMIVLAELEVWPNLIAAADRQSIPVAVINGRLSEASYRGYRRLSGIARRTFSRLSLVLCQDETYAQRFVSLGVMPTRVRVTGSIKFDDAPMDRETSTAIACADRAGLRPWHRVWVAGSTQAGEEAIVLRVYRKLHGMFPDLRLLIVPRHPERFDACAGEIRSAGLRCIRRSEVGNTFPDQPLDQESIFLVDTIGELRDWWATAEIAFVGGSFGNRGGQNMLEPAGYGAAVCFGPNTRNFRDIVGHLLAADAAVQLADEAALQSFVLRCLTQPSYVTKLGQAARDVVREHRGASDRTLRALEQVLPPKALRTAA